MKPLEIAPRASMLIESMRDIGYSLETALADVIDNSIAAGAGRIGIVVDPSDTEPRIAIVDDGEGMTGSALLDAMRAGSRNPLDVRDKDDLGRFGLGLKTASFSQCRRLTVVTRKAGVTSAAIWDLDHVAATDRWEILIPDYPDTLPLADTLGSTGTAVIWERLDRLHGALVGAQRDEVLVRRLGEAARHLALVFHRYLAPEPRQRRVMIDLNGQDLKGHDPFGSGHAATQRLDVEEILIRGHRVVIEPFTLPHHSKLTSDEYESLGGDAGYLRNQGFYLYRERRLIIHGTWFGLARHAATTNLSRIRIDMPKELDADWKIDVKKASAQPPPVLRTRLRQLVEQIGASSKRVYTHKGQRIDVGKRLDVWSRVQDKGQIRYRFNTEHPAWDGLMADLPEAFRPRIRALVELMESMIPFDAIFADRGGDPKATLAAPVADESFVLLARDTYLHLNAGTEERSEKVIEMMSHCEPFASRWEETQVILKAAFEWE